MLKYLINEYVRNKRKSKVKIKNENHHLFTLISLQTRMTFFCGVQEKRFWKMFLCIQQKSSGSKTTDGLSLCGQKTT